MFPNAILLIIILVAFAIVISTLGYAVAINKSSNKILDKLDNMTSKTEKISEKIDDTKEKINHV